MSTQKGNSNRSRSQNIEVANVCERCKKVIEWKIKYKKYKPLKAPSKCIKCEQKTVKHAYHKICLPCAKQHEICPKCGNTGDIVEGKPNKEEATKLDAELQSLLKTLPERKRRSFIRYMNRNVTKRNLKKNKNVKKNEDEETDEDGEQEQDTSVMETMFKENLLLKLKSLVIKEEDTDDFNSDDDSDSFM
ncbi:Uncharacterized protein C9orf85 homolog [Anthophora plagiata]